MVDYDEIQYEWGYKDGYSQAYKEIERNSDYVKVIRCKDCKNGVCTGKYYFCNVRFDEWGQPYEVKPDGFCDCGDLVDSMFVEKG